MCSPIHQGSYHIFIVDAKAKGYLLFSIVSLIFSYICPLLLICIAGIWVCYLCMKKISESLEKAILNTYSVLVNLYLWQDNLPSY